VNSPIFSTDWYISYKKREEDRFSDIHDLVHDLVADEGMKAFRSNEIDSNIETIRDQVFQVHECHHAYRMIEFHHKVEIALFGLVFSGVRTKDTDAPDVIPLLKLMPHVPQLIHYGGCIPHVPDEI